ncbi:hypothetical protein L3Q82_025363 [Scortum barcoo]|uniref:Uncharacterized protein n=1 Tax=Scortum barcoo TaxID=214431 RepID=A0ACB8WQT8_9TELE|nr:hypothetical protein L3Q82_025363 [Scortum barcoo]
MFFDFSSAFNTRDKLQLAGVDHHLTSWILDYLTHRAQFVRVQGSESDRLLCSTTDGDDREYRGLIQDFADWCLRNNLQINGSKTKELVVDFRRRSHSPPAPALGSSFSERLLHPRCVKERWILISTHAHLLTQPEPIPDAPPQADPPPTRPCSRPPRSPKPETETETETETEESECDLEPQPEVSIKIAAGAKARVKAEPGTALTLPMVQVAAAIKKSCVGNEDARLTELIRHAKHAERQIAAEKTKKRRTRDDTYAGRGVTGLPTVPREKMTAGPGMPAPIRSLTEPKNKSEMKFSDSWEDDSFSSHDKVTWTREADQAFSDLKLALQSSPTLGLPDPTKPFTQAVDERDGCMTFSSSSNSR